MWPCRGGERCPPGLSRLRPWMTGAGQRDHSLGVFAESTGISDEGSPQAGEDFSSVQDGWLSSLTEPSRGSQVLCRNRTCRWPLEEHSPIAAQRLLFSLALAQNRPLCLSLNHETPPKVRD